MSRCLSLRAKIKVVTEEVSKFNPRALSLRAIVEQSSYGPFLNFDLVEKSKQPHVLINKPPFFLVIIEDRFIHFRR